jgi:formate hydrogenlyase subunit 3/multisubunit Na+/H+ antiporter MnhD subunit
MPVIVASIFSALIIFITVTGIIRVLYIGYTRKEINHRKYIGYASASIVIGGIISITIPFAYERIFSWVLGA